MSLVISWIVCGVWALLSIPSLVFMLINSLNNTQPYESESSNKPTTNDDNSPTDSNATPPKISIVVPARDEATSIEKNLTSLLKSDYPNLEIVAVNDRSQDNTGDLMDKVAAEHENIKVIHVSELPADWLGKNHAMQVAAAQATGDWILFTDGDVIFDPSALSRAMNYVETHKVDHLCIMPTMILSNLFEGIIVAGFTLCFAVGIQPVLVKTRFPLCYFGIGAFNMVKRTVFESFDGFGKIRFDVLDDVKLGKLVKQHGFQQMVLRNANLVSVRWQESAWGIVRGLEKNAFAASDYSVIRGVVVTLLLATLFFGPYLGIALTTGPTQWGYIATACLMHTMYTVMAVMLGSSLWAWPGLPVAICTMLLAYWRSAAITLKQNGIYWRDTFYSLKELKAGLYK